MAHSPILSAPILYTSSDLKSDLATVTKITELVNNAFKRSKKPEPVKWGVNPRERFPDHESYFDMLGSEGIVALIYDKETRDQKIVAVAAAIPWQGGWKKEGAGVEEGWEIKAVAVNEDARYLRRGLAVQLYDFLEQYLVMKSQHLGISTTGRTFDKADKLTLWILAAECINGRYWRRKGYEPVRKEVAKAPTWGVLTEFEMIVLRRSIPIRLPEADYAVGSATNSTGMSVEQLQEVEVK